MTFASMSNWQTEADSEQKTQQKEEVGKGEGREREVAAEKQRENDSVD